MMALALPTLGPTRKSFGKIVSPSQSWRSPHPPLCCSCLSMCSLPILTSLHTAQFEVLGSGCKVPT